MMKNQFFSLRPAAVTLLISAAFVCILAGCGSEGSVSGEDVVTRQFYIVGDQRYCLIHLTNFTGSEQADDAARAMADSFVWN